MISLAAGPNVCSISPASGIPWPPKPGRHAILCEPPAGPLALDDRYPGRVVVIHDPDNQRRADCCAALRQEGLDARESKDGLHHAIALLDDTTILVLVIEDLAESEAFRTLGDLMWARPGQPVILVTAFTTSNAHALAKVLVTEVTWLASLPTGLRVSVRRALMTSMRYTVARSIASCEDLNPILRRGLVRSAQAEVPFVSVSAMANAIGVNRRTLAKYWRQGPGARCGTLKDFVRWLVLLRAAELSSRGTRGRDVARALGIDLRTIGRHAKRLCGTSLSTLGHMRPDEVLSRMLESNLWLPEAEDVGDILA